MEYTVKDLQKWLHEVAIDNQRSKEQIQKLGSKLAA